MRIWKGQTVKPGNRIRNFYIMRYLGIGLALLCMPFLPANVPEFHPFFKSRYWLLADVLFLWSTGAIFEKSLFQAILRDAREKKEGGDALNASSLLFFATPLLFLFDAAALAHLYAMWYFWPQHRLPGMSERLQCAALAVGLVLCIYGRFLPAFPPGSRFGLRTRAACASEEAWRAVQKASAKRLMAGGFLLTLPCLFLSGAPALATALIVGGGAVASCYLVRA